MWRRWKSIPCTVKPERFFPLGQRSEHQNMKKSAFPFCGRFRIPSRFFEHLEFMPTLLGTGYMKQNRCIIRYFFQLLPALRFGLAPNLWDRPHEGPIWGERVTNHIAGAPHIRAPIRIALRTLTRRNLYLPDDNSGQLRRRMHLVHPELSPSRSTCH